jgi:hypothetical protein
VFDTLVLLILDCWIGEGEELKAPRYASAAGHVTT